MELRKIKNQNEKLKLVKMAHKAKAEALKQNKLKIEQLLQKKLSP
jgi:hypothetical protein